MHLAAPALALLAASSQTPSTWRQYATPEDAGFSPERLAEAWEHADRLGSAAVFVVHRGHALVAWGEVERRYECHSVRKSLMNALVGQAVAAGELDPEATLAELGIDDREPLSESERGARLMDLLAARSGVYHPAAKEPPDMRTERPARGSAAPGEHFFYNNWDFNLPGTLLERATGADVSALFQERLAAPLGMEDFRPRDVCAQLEPSFSRFPAHAFRLSARDLARFGELYRNSGSLAGRALVPAAWVADSTRAHTDLGRGRGYGLGWWTYAPGSLPEHPRLDAHGCFAGVGTGGQLVLVVPGAELVLVHRADTDHERPVRGADVWALAERILAARTGEPAAAPELVPLAVERFSAPAPPLPDRARHEPPVLDAARIAGLTGEYAFPDGSRVRVFEHAGRLFAHRSDGEEAELFPLSDARFYLWYPSFEVAFERSADGTARTVELVTPRGTLAGERAGGG
jgi:CubicO group peptidase (beta-lactamase class C family)